MSLAKRLLLGALVLVCLLVAAIVLLSGNRLESRLVEETTAELGLIFDESYYGPGVKIAEILKRGPADRRGIGLRPGDIIRSIDGVELTDGVSVSQVLNDKAGETLVLQVTSSPSADMKDPRAFRKIELQALGR